MALLEVTFRLFTPSSIKRMLFYFLFWGQMNLGSHFETQTRFSTFGDKRIIKTAPLFD